MTTNTKVALAAGAVALAVGVPYLLKLQRLSNELETVTKVKVHEVNLTGIKLRVDVTMKNPSGGKLRLKFPFVKMIYSGTTFATSEMKNVDIEIEKFSQKELEPVYVELPLLSLASTVPGMLTEYRKTGKMRITVRTVTTLNVSVPYSRTEQLTV